jgi:hypothetical protein
VIRLKQADKYVGIGKPQNDRLELAAFFLKRLYEGFTSDLAVHVLNEEEQSAILPDLSRAFPDPPGQQPALRRLDIARRPFQNEPASSPLH